MVEILKKKSNIFSLSDAIPYVVAGGFSRAWASLLLGLCGVHDVVPVWLSLNDAFDFAYCFVIAIILCNVSRISVLNEVRWIRPFVFCLMAAAAVFGYAALAIREYMVQFAVVGACLGGIGFRLLMLLASEALSALNLVRVALYYSMGHFLSVVVVYFCSALDELRLTQMLLILPIVALYCTALSTRNNPVGKPVSAGVASAGIPWRPFILLAVYSFVYGFSEHAFPENAGIEATLSTAMAMAILFLYAYLLPDKLRGDVLYRVALVMMIAGLLAIPLSAVMGSVVAGHLISMALWAFSSLVTLLSYDISKRFGVSILIFSSLISLKQLFVVTGEKAHLFLEFHGFGESDWVNWFSIALAIVLLLTAAVLLFSRDDLKARWKTPIFDRGIDVERIEREEFVAIRCKAVSERFSLTPREREVLFMMASGKTTPAIAEKLGVSEGTVKAHVSHVYTKVGVRKKKELMTIVGEID